MIIHSIKTFWRKWIIHKTQLRQTRRSTRAGPGEEGGVSNLVICLVIITASTSPPWQNSRDDLAGLWVVAEWCTTLALRMKLGKTRGDEEEKNERAMPLLKQFKNGAWARKQLEPRTGERATVKISNKCQEQGLDRSPERLSVAGCFTTGGDLPFACALRPHEIPPRARILSIPRPCASLDI